MKRKKLISVIAIFVSWAIALYSNFQYFLFGDNPPILSTIATILYLIIWLAGSITLNNQPKYLLILASLKIVEIGVIPLYSVLNYPTILLIPIVFLLPPYYGIKIFSAYHNSPYLYILLAVQLVVISALIIKSVGRKKSLGSA